MEPPPKAKRGPCGPALQVLECQLALSRSRLLQGPFAYVFWLIEQAQGLAA